MPISPLADICVKDNDILDLGEIQCKVIHTPGHSPGGICLLVEGNLFTGDTLFVGGVGRTDLPGGSLDQLVVSIKTKIYTLPDNTIIWPGHDYGAGPSSTVEYEKRTNPYTK